MTKNKGESGPGTPANPLTASAVVGGRVAELRKKRGWSAQELARRLEGAGEPGLNRWVIANLESGRRESVSIDEVLVLAHVLSVAPVHLFVDVEGRWMEVGNESVSPDLLREWVRGNKPLLGEDPVRYKEQTPEREWEPRKSLDELIGDQQVWLQRLREAREREKEQQRSFARRQKLEREQQE